MNKKSENTSGYCSKQNKENTKAKMNCAVVIPALNPTYKLVEFTKELIKSGIPKIIVINDGSDSSFNDIFNEVGQLGQCTVLTHKENRGKGRALKTAFSFIAENHPDLDGVVTADADGQHAVEDVLKISEMLSSHQNTIILGVRNFREENVPRRSYIGNLTTSVIFHLLYGYKLDDTQTGLRGFPVHYLSWLIHLKGERYDYETNMLIYARQNDIGFTTVPIKTLYFDNNAGSHYSTIKDSAFILFRILSGLAGYLMPSIMSGILDLSLFFLLNTFVFASLPALKRIFFSTVVARVIASVFNYLINLTEPFSLARKSMVYGFRSYIMFTTSLVFSACLVYSLSLVWSINETVIKLFADVVLGCVGYRIRLYWANLK